MLKMLKNAKFDFSVFKQSQQEAQQNQEVVQKKEIDFSQAVAQLKKINNKQ